MTTYFDILLNMSITGSVVILVVILMRFLLARAPKIYSYILWSIVGFRLCCPFSFKSFVSIFNINPIQNPSDIVTNNGTMNYIDAPFYITQPTIDGITMDGYTIGGANNPVTTIVEHNFTDYMSYIWLAGTLVILAYGLINFLVLKHKLNTATKKSDNIYQSEKIDSPFILGIIRPKIYVPYTIDKEYFEYVVAHEKHHIKRCDNIIKFVAFVILCVHWFNPLCWLAFYLMNKDMEMSCDEWVLSHNDGIKKIYSNALLSFATIKKFPSPSPLCFGEGSAKSRIKNVLKFKKPTIVVSIITIFLCIVTVVVCISNPKQDIKKIPESSSSNYDNKVSEFNPDENSNDQENLDNQENLDIIQKKYSFIFDRYWYTVNKDEEETTVCCYRFLKNSRMETTIYTLKDNKWTESYCEYPYYFDENDTIVFDWKSGFYSKAFIQIDTKNKTIAEYDRNTMNSDISKQKVLVKYIQKSENSLETAKSVLND